MGHLRGRKQFTAAATLSLPSPVFNASSNSHRPRFNAPPINAGGPPIRRLVHFPSSPLLLYPSSSARRLAGPPLSSAACSSRSTSSQHGGAAVAGGGGVVVRVVGGGGGAAVAGAAVCGPAADQVRGGLREADGLPGLRDGARGVAVVAVLRRRSRHAEVEAAVPLLHHPAGAQRPQRGAVARAQVRPPHGAPPGLQARQRQRHALHQPAEPEAGLVGLRTLRQRIQHHAISRRQSGERQRRRQRLQASDRGPRQRRAGRALSGDLICVLIPRASKQFNFYPVDSLSSFTFTGSCLFCTHIKID